MYKSTSTMYQRRGKFLTDVSSMAVGFKRERGGGGFAISFHPALSPEPPFVRFEERRRVSKCRGCKVSVSAPSFDWSKASLPVLAGFRGVSEDDGIENGRQNDPALLTSANLSEPCHASFRPLLVPLRAWTQTHTDPCNAIMLAAVRH